jgi:hypothetical protein
MRSTPADAATIVIDRKRRWQPPLTLLIGEIPTDSSGISLTELFVYR